MKRFVTFVLTAVCAASMGCSKTSVSAPAVSENRAQVVVAAGAGYSGATPRILDQHQRFHLLSRFTFGPTVESMRRLEELGLEGWLNEQLAVANSPNAELDQALDPYKKALGTPGDLVRLYQYDATTRLKQHGEQSSNLPEFERLVRNTDTIEMLRDLQMVELTRHLLSTLQIQEVMVDLWTNHFNVYARKDRVSFATSDYLERAIRPHALGRFTDLLEATARHPAMLQYLDNARNRTPSSTGGSGVNENYARELLELHTVGVAAGYTQKDVSAAAHILTGWSVENTTEGEFGFLFRTAWHTNQPQTVLGRTFSATGIHQGEDLLRWLAIHPATARHVAAKLCTRFVADTPPSSCVQAASEAFLATEGDLTTVLRAIVNDESFWLSHHQMVKTPLDFLMSATRAVGGVPDGGHNLAKNLDHLGQPLLFNRVPTGYPTDAASWASTHGMMARFRFATRFASGLVGVRLPTPSVFAGADTPIALQEIVEEKFPVAALHPEMLDAFVEPLLAVERAERRPMLAISMLVASAEFQRK